MTTAIHPKKAHKSRARWQDAEEMRWAVREWAAKIGVKVNRINVRAMTSKWASVSTKGRISLNQELLKMPKEFGNFVIAHELIHLLVPNHGKLFKSFMHAYFPGWERLLGRLNRGKAS
jgi:predicted metal-dependent hydrolase